MKQLEFFLASYYYSPEVKVIDRNTSARREMCSKLAVKTPERRQ